MHRHHVTSEQLTAPRLALDRAAAHHLQGVLRLREGDAVELFDGAGRTVRSRVCAVDRGGLVLEQTESARRHAPPNPLTLGLCVSKGKRMDWTIEKAVELGVTWIVPTISGRTIVRLDGEDAAERLARWERVAVDAARQCGTCWLPRIEEACPFPRAVEQLKSCRPLLVAALTPGAKPLRDVLSAPGLDPRWSGAGIAWVVGPEGDFTAAELAMLLDAGAVPVSLGANILRTETAALYGMCVLGAMWATRAGPVGPDG